MKVIDLRSDTVTLPTAEMLRAMSEAELGDDVYQEDPTVNHLETLSAQLLGKEAALLTASGTMSNLIAVLTHTSRGEEIIVGSEAHMFWYEVGGASALAGVSLHTVPNRRDGTIAPHDLEQAVRPDNIHHPKTTLLCLENTHNRCGGAVLTPQYMLGIAETARRRGLKIHLDGARIFNASVALNLSAKELAEHCDSVCFCLSKGLSAPVGSLICGSREFITEARKWRKMLGGGMRQAGVIAAAGIVALETMISRLAEDHATARRLAEGLNLMAGIKVSLEKVQTNIVYFDLADKIPVTEFIGKLASNCVKLSHFGGQRFRAVTHRMLTAADIDEALTRIDGSK
jgi:threonine aldolase